MVCRTWARSFKSKHVWTMFMNKPSTWQRVLSTSSAGQSSLQKPYYITTPIFYPNSDPHLGHLYSTVVADIIARYSLLKEPSRPVVFITGTDEHGGKIQKAAHVAGMEGQELEFCDKISANFQDLAKISDLSHTRFIRTTEAEHAIAVQHLWRELKARGFLYKGTHRGWYSISDECFYTDSQVQSLIHPENKGVYMISKESRNIVEWCEEENYRFKLSAFREQLLKRYLTDSTAILPHEQRNLVLDLLQIQDNVADIAVSRPSTRLKWGIQVPDDPQHTVYVWLDALTAYLTAVGYPWSGNEPGNFPRGWPPDVQIIGKDILRFHAIYFPAFLMALDLPLPKILVSHAHLTVNREKMSKSVGNTANPFTILEKYGTSEVRYYLSRIGGRYNADRDWSEIQLLKHRRELVSTLGNLLSRAFSTRIVDRLPVSERYISIKPEVFEQEASRNTVLLSELKAVIGRYPVHMDNLEISHALEIIVGCLNTANREYTSVAPWLNSTRVTDISTLLSQIRETLRICGILMQPFIPSKAGELLNALGVPADRRTLRDAEIGKGELNGDAQVAVQAIKLFDSVDPFVGDTLSQRSV